MLLRYFFGDDIFISYSRKDGKLYATKLKEQLKSMDYSCFIDFEKIYAGDHLSHRIQRAIRGCGVLVLVGTEGARNSEFVNLEIESFLKTGRTLVPIDVKDEVENKPWASLPGHELVWIDEPNGEEPSPEIYAEIKRLFGSRRRNVRLRALATFIALILITVAVIAVLQAREARQQQALAEDRKLTAQSGELASWARSQLYDDPELGLLLAIEAVDRKPTLTAELALKQLLVETHLKKVWHTGRLWFGNLVVSRDGRWIITTGFDAEARLWDAAEGKGVQINTGLRVNAAEAAGLYSITAAFGPGDTLLFTNGRVVKEFKLEASGPGAGATGEGVELQGQEGRILSFSFSPDGMFIVTTGENGAARVWDARTGRGLYALKGHRGEVFKGEFSPDGKYLTTSGEDQTVRVWEVESGRAAGVLNTEVRAYVPIAIGPGGKTVVIGYKSPQLWRLYGNGWKAEDDTFDGHEDRLWNVAFSSDGKFLVTTSHDRTARVWDAEEVKELAVLRGHKNAVTSAVFSPGGETVFTTGDDWTVRAWDAALPAQGVTLRKGFDPFPEGSVSPNGELAVVIKDGVAELRETATERLVAELRGHEGRVSEALFSPDGKFLVTRGEKPAALVREGSSGRILLELEGLEEGDYKIYFTPDGRYVLASGRNNATTRVWESGTGKLFHTPVGGTTTAPIFSPDSSLVLTGRDQRGVREVLEVGTGKKLGELSETEGHVKQAAFSPDSKYLVTVAELLRVRNARTLESISEAMNPPPLGFDISFSRDGNLVAVVGRHVRIFETQTGRLVSALGENKGFDLFPGKAIFSPDNKYLVTSGNYVRLWDVAAGVLLANFKLSSKNLADASFSQDDKKLTLRGDNGAMEVFDCKLCGSVKELRDFARGLVTRALTEDERRRYLPEP